LITEINSENITSDNSKQFTTHTHTHTPIRT